MAHKRRFGNIAMPLSLSLSFSYLSFLFDFVAEQ